MEKTVIAIREFNTKNSLFTSLSKFSINRNMVQAAFEVGHDYIEKEFLLYPINMKTGMVDMRGGIPFDKIIRNFPKLGNVLKRIVYFLGSRTDFNYADLIITQTGEVLFLDEKGNEISY